MDYPSPLEKVTLVARSKRFLAEVRREGGAPLTVHCANSGSMKTCFETGWPGWISKSPNPDRKLSHTLELVDNGRGPICVNTGMANRVVEEALSTGLIPELAGYSVYRSESVWKPGTRFDFSFGNGDRAAGYLEVKSVSMVRDGSYRFPDAVTERGQKHLRELMAAKKEGFRAVLLFLLMRGDAERFEPAADIDPEYARLLAEAGTAGVEILVYGTVIGGTGIKIGSKL
jgi:sugar fermentation stimulation protein A